MRRISLALVAISSVVIVGACGNSANPKEEDDAGGEGGQQAGGVGSGGGTAEGGNGGSPASGGSNAPGGGGSSVAGNGGSPPETGTVDTSSWGPCQNVVVPPGVTINPNGGAPLLTMPTVANKCLPDGAAISRTMALLATSKPNERHRVRILYYGQSITRDGNNTGNEWFKKVTDTLRTRYPNADIETDMLAVGGFGALEMQGPSKMDFPAFYPDLVIWQNYGGHLDMDPLVQYWRRSTTAELALQNWHPKGTDKVLSTTNGEERMSYIYIPDLAKRLGGTLVDVRTPWRARWMSMNTPVSDLVAADNVHLATVGSAWMAEFTLAALTYNEKTVVDPLKMVRTYKVGTEVQWNGGKLTLPFEGNRVEILAAPGTTTAAGAADVTIDGMSPSSLASAYVHGRPNGTTDGDWPWKTGSPSVIEAKSKVVVEDWTLTINQINYGSPLTCTYSVVGSVTGADGTGKCESNFTSTSGRVYIPTVAWKHLPSARTDNYKVTVKAGDTYKWSVKALHSDKYPPAALTATDGNKEYWTLIVSNIVNGKHTLQLTANGASPPQIAAIRVYRPPLR